MPPPTANAPDAPLEDLAESLSALTYSQMTVVAVDRAWITTGQTLSCRIPGRSCRSLRIRRRLLCGLMTVADSPVGVITRTSLVFHYIDAAECNDRLVSASLIDSRLGVASFRITTSSPVIDRLGV